MSLLLKASSAGAAKLALDVSAPGVLLKSYPIAVRRISARARKRWARAAQLPEAGRSLGLVAVDGAHQLVRQLGVVRGRARRGPARRPAARGGRRAAPNPPAAGGVGAGPASRLPAVLSSKPSTASLAKPSACTTTSSHHTPASKDSEATL